MMLMMLPPWPRACAADADDAASFAVCLAGACAANARGAATLAAPWPADADDAAPVSQVGPGLVQLMLMMLLPAPRVGPGLSQLMLMMLPSCGALARWC